MEKISKYFKVIIFTSFLVWQFLSAFGVSIFPHTSLNSTAILVNAQNSGVQCDPILNDPTTKEDPADCGAGKTCDSNNRCVALSKSGGTPTGNPSGGTHTGDPKGTPTGNPNSSAIDCKKSPDSCVYNPLATDELTTLFLWIAKGMLSIVAVWAVIFIIVGGFQMVMSQGNEEAYTTAKKTVIYAVLGVIVSILSFSIIAVVQNLLHADIRPGPPL
jgi:hypothetical protein